METGNQRNRYYFTAIRLAKIRKLDISVGGKAGGMGVSCTADENVGWSSHSGEPSRNTWLGKTANTL